ncbi:MAG: PspA/IM30 family protein [Chloroflexota bacterium]
MSGILGRMSTIFRAKMNRALDSAEDPGETLDFSYEKQLQLLQNVRRGIADVVTAKSRLQLQQNQLQDKINKTDDQARQALSMGREDLARMALSRKQDYQQQANGLAAQVEQLQMEQQKMIDGEQRLSAKIEAFRTQKETIKAQYTAAQAQVKIGEAATGLSEEIGDVNLAVQRAQDKTAQLKARSVAIDELTASGALPDLIGAPQDDIDRELAKLGPASTVDAELERMKRQLGPAGGPMPQLEAGHPQEPHE